MHCLLIDDNKKTADHLSALLEKIPGIYQVHKAVQPYLLRSVMDLEPIEIIFSRVRLWNFRAFSRLDTMVPIVFLCGGKDKLTDKEDTAVPYKLREPYTAFELEQLLKKISKDRIVESPDYFFIKYEARHHRIFFSDIEMIERKRMGYVQIYTKKLDMLISGTLNSWLQQLPEGRFIRAADSLVLPIGSLDQIRDNVFEHRGNKIKLTYRFAKEAQKELETESDWDQWSGQH